MAAGVGRRSGSDASKAAVMAALRRCGPMTRHALGVETGLSRATVSAALVALAAEGRVRESAQGTGGRGRPSMLISVNSARVDLVGVEIGRAHVAVAVADAADEVVGRADAEVAAEAGILARADAALALLDGLAAEQGLDFAGVRGVAVGTPGPKFGAGNRGSLDLALARFARDRSAVAAHLADYFGVGVRAENNTRCTALGEASMGTAVGARNVVYVRLDQGVGGGVVVDGALLSGSWGTAGEFGHMCVDSAGLRCACGGRGCVELYASVPALLTAAGSSDLVALIGRLEAGDPVAEAALDRAVSAVAQALAGVLAVLDTSVVVVGGRVGQLPGFLGRLERVLHDLVPSWCAADLAVRLSRDDRMAGAYGALVHARSVATDDAAGGRLRQTK